jgi:hypothetical protein
MGLHKHYGGYQNSTTYRASAIRWLLQLMFKNVSLTVLPTVILLHLIEWCIYTCMHYVHNNTDISGQEITVRTTQVFQKNSLQIPLYFVSIIPYNIHTPTKKLAMCIC